MLYYIKSHLSNGDIYSTSYDKETQRSKFWSKAIESEDAEFSEGVEFITFEEGKMRQTDNSDKVMRTYRVNGGDTIPEEWTQSTSSKYEIYGKKDGQWKSLNVFFDAFGEANKFVKAGEAIKYFDILAVVENVQPVKSKYERTANIYDDD